MKTKLVALKAFKNWDVVPCPHTMNIIGSKWAYFVQLRSDGSLESYEARLASMGNCQEYGIDYDDSFAPMAKITIVHLYITCSFTIVVFTSNGCEERSFIKLPFGMSLPSANSLCKLRCLLYGFKQAP